MRCKKLKMIVTAAALSVLQMCELPYMKADAVLPDISCDVNGDGIFTAADLVMFQEWLTGKNVTLSFPQNADICSDGRIDSFDFVLMRKKLLKTSYSGGFYSTEFDLSFPVTYNAQILYTTDGSDPRYSASAKVYSDTLKIYNNTSDPNIYSSADNMTWIEDLKKTPDFPVEKGIVIRSVSRDSSGNFGKVVTNTYFAGERADYFKELKVMSITSDAENFFDDKKGIFVNGNYGNSGKDWERPCNIQVFDRGRAVFSQDVGVRVAGNWSRNYPQKGMTLYARKEYGPSKMNYDFFDGNAIDISGKIIGEFKKVTLRNGGDGFDSVRFRDDLNAYLARGLDISVQTKNDYIVFINGEFWGYYSMQEKFEDNYIESHYGVSANNVTTNKCGEFEGNMAFESEYNSFFDWACSADMTVTENYNKFCDTIDVQSFIDYIAVESYICNWDSLVNVNNYMLWRANNIDRSNPYADGKWRFMLYDTEYSSGFSWTSYKTPYILELDDSGKPGSFGTILYNLLNNEDFRLLFRESYYRIAEENFAPEKVSERIDYYLDRLTDAYKDTEKRFCYDSDFENGSETVREFFRKRPDYALAQLDELLEKYS